MTPEAPARSAPPALRFTEALEMTEGAGARVKRLLPTPATPPLDPFVMLDEFSVSPPAGFPDHPHRGFEIVTYMTEGAFRHRDDLGNDSTIGAGGVQRVTAGRGIVHSEMPASEGENRGFQLWINLPRRLKGIDPDYQEARGESFPEDAPSPGVRVRTIVGEGSPVKLQTPVRYFDVHVEAGADYAHPVPEVWNGFLYVQSGAGTFAGGEPAFPGRALLVENGGEAVLNATGDARFILVMGRPHGEPMRLRGPFVD